MEYKIKVNLIQNEKMHKPGSILPSNISSADLEFLKRKGFVEPTDTLPENYEDPESYIHPEDDWENGFTGIDGFREAEPGELKSPDEVWKIRSKKEAALYAKSIGLDLEEDYREKPLKELQAAIIDFQEELMMEGGDGGELQ